MFNCFIRNQSQFATKKIRSVRQRIKHYAKSPNHFKFKTVIRPPDLRDPEIVFPIKIPIRYRHVFHVKKQLFIDNSSKIHWNRLSPNEILLGLEKSQYLEFYELTQGLKYLSLLKDQENHDWNEHEWVKNAMDRIRDNFGRIRQVDIMKYYHLMKKLNYKDPEFWSKMYKKIQLHIYDISPGDFEHIFMNYYDSFEEYFSPEARGRYNTLMEGRLRQFSGASIVKLFKIFLKEQRLDNFWFQSVFITLFRNRSYYLDGYELGYVFRYMMTINLENHERLYQGLYERIPKLKPKEQEQIQFLEDVLLQVKEVFRSHRVQPSMEALEKVRQDLIERLKQKPKTFEEIVREDLRFFMTKKKLKQANKGFDQS